MIVLLRGAWQASEDAKDVVARIAASLEPFEVELSRITQGDRYFQCVYALCEKSDALLHARRTVAHQFSPSEQDSTSGYMPHLSLGASRMPRKETPISTLIQCTPALSSSCGSVTVYGLSSMEQREEAVSRLAPVLERKNVVRVTRVSCWNTPGPAETWERLAEAPLGAHR